MQTLRLIPLLLLSGIFFFASCIKEDDDPCKKTASAEKVVNIRAELTIESTQGIPRPDEFVTFSIKLIRCNQEIEIEDFSTTTDINGMITTEISNFVLNNTVDKIEILAIAPDLIDYETQNFELITKKYEELNGFGLTSFDLTIITKE